jgi:glycosyltransferase involved in cell wall biosynthesis
MSKPSVINLSFSTAWGGLEMSSVKWTRLFHQAGYPSLEICQPGTPIEKALGDQGLEHLSVPIRNYVSPRATLLLRREIKRRNARALFLHSMKDIWLVTPALIGMPEVKLFGFARMFFKDISKKDLGHILMYSRLNRMIALSEIQKQHLANCLPVPENKFVVVPNGVDTERFKPRARREDIRQSWTVKSDNLLFGLIGRLDRQKGSLEFVEAAGTILKTYPHARFVMVGGNTLGESDIGREVRDKMESLGLDGKVILTDFRTDIPDVMNALDVFVMPSYEENFANVMLEALASGLPCIGTDSGGTPEILSFGKTGVLCQPRSAQALADAMADLARSEDRRKSFAQAARSKAEREYEMSTVFTRVEQLLNS